MAAETLALRNRLVAATLQTAQDELALVRVDAASALFGVSATGAPVAIITYRGEALEAFGNRLLAVMQAQPGTLYLVIVGGEDAPMRACLEDVARKAPELRSLGLYHLVKAGTLAHVEGRHLGPLEAAAKKLATWPAVSEAELSAEVERAQKRHAEAVSFAQQTRGRFPLVSLILGALCVLVFLRGGTPGSGGMANAIFGAGANYGPAVTAGEVWRLLSYAFLHGSQTHLLVNMLSLYFLGSFLEQVVGRARYLLIYGLSGLGAGAASALLGGEVPSVGASGAIWGLMTAGFGLALKPAGILPPVIASRLKRGLATPLLINIALSFVPGIDLRAHFGGGAVGLALALSGWLGNRTASASAAADALAQGKPVPTPRWITAAAVLVAAAMALCLGIALVKAQELAGRSPQGTAAGTI